jgi:hypothetical protein
MTLTSAETVLVVFVGNVAETIFMLDSAQVQASFLATVLETLEITDSQCQFGWFKIENNQVPDWGFKPFSTAEIHAYGAFTFGGVPMAGSITESGVQANSIPEAQTPNWSSIDTGQATTWSDINSNQNC